MPPKRSSFFLAVCVGCSVAAGYAEPPPPTFGAGAEAITVDVVVLDSDGRPVRGLGPADFEVFEAKRPQRLVGFEARDLPAATAAPLEAGALEIEALVATNEARTRPGRVLAILIDDLGINPSTAGELKAALASWIRHRADAGDEITVATTSGNQWWSDVVATGREDLLTVLGRVQGRLLAQGGGFDMSTTEAYRIAVLEQAADISGQGSGRSRTPDAFGIRGGGIKLLGGSAIESVTQRWLDSGACAPCLDPNDSPADCREIRLCRQRVHSLAREMHARWLRRATGVLSSVAGLSRSLAGEKGRKSILLVSEEFLHDSSLAGPMRDAIDAAQRSNTAVYFSSARGLVGSSSMSAAGSSTPPRSQDIGSPSTEATLATAGGEALADATGGTATRSNDLAAGLDVMARHSSSYYLLGYQPEKAPDGEWRKLEVKVARPGVRVRARPGYRALRPADLAKAEAQVEDARDKPKSSSKEKAQIVSKRPVSPELLVGTARGSLPLRLAAYLQETNDSGLARVGVALEIDNGRVEVDRSVLPWRALMDLTIMAASLDGAPSIPVDERLALSLGPREVGTGWWLVPRDLWLPSGSWQIRALVRDVRSGSTGLVTQRVQVPDVDETYLSTPIMTDRVSPSTVVGEPPRLVPAAHRRFSRRAPLHCQFEVFVFAGRNIPGVAQLSSGFSIERPDGQPVSVTAPSPILTDGRRAVRRIVLPVESLDPGIYVLVVGVEDELTGRRLSARVPFELEGDAHASVPPEAAPQDPAELPTRQAAP